MENDLPPLSHFPCQRTVFWPRWRTLHWGRKEEYDGQNGARSQCPYSCGNSAQDGDNHNAYSLGVQRQFTVTWQVQIYLLLGHSPHFFFSLPCWCLCLHPPLQLFVTSACWWHYTCLSSLNKAWSMLCHPACSSVNTLTELVSNDAVWSDW